MTEPTPHTRLLETIAALEEKQAAQKELLQVQFRETYEELKPVNLLKRSIQGAFELKGSGKALLGLAAPLLMGYATSKLGRKKAAAKAAPEGFLNNLATFVVNNPDLLVTLGGLISGLFRKKRTER